MSNCSDVHLFESLWNMALWTILSFCEEFMVNLVKLEFWDNLNSKGISTFFRIHRIYYLLKKLQMIEYAM